MRYLKLDYRVSLLRAAAYHGASHQAAMVFQVIVPKQLRGFDIGRQKFGGNVASIRLEQSRATSSSDGYPEWDWLLSED